MRSLITGLVLAATMFVFTGCVTTQVGFKQEFIEKNLEKDLNKVESLTPSIQIQENLVITKNPNSFRGKLTKAEVQLKDINEKVLVQFMGQYFNNVKLTNTKTQGLYIDSKFKDYNFAYGGFTDGATSEVFVDTKIYYNGKLILNKSYRHELGVYGYTLKFSMEDMLRENMLETLLALYETKVKPDMLEALRKNI